MKRTWRSVFDFHVRFFAPQEGVIELKNREFQRAMACEALILMSLLALLTYITRLWPILLWVILGIFAAVIRLLFLSVREVKPDKTALALPVGRMEPQQSNMEAMVFMIVQRRIGNDKPFLSAIPR